MSERAEEPESHGWDSAVGEAPDLSGLRSSATPAQALRALAQRELGRVLQDASLSPSRRIALVGALDLMVSNRPTARARGLQLYTAVLAEEQRAQAATALQELRTRLRGSSDDLRKPIVGS